MMSPKTTGAVALSAVTLPKSILVAEDNDALREVMTAFLTMGGYRVVACCDGQSALETFQAGETVDLLLTDLEMPRKSGVDLARAITGLRSSLPVVMVSGSLISVALEQEMRNRNWSFLSKPYAVPLLLEEVARLLDCPVEQKGFADRKSNAISPALPSIVDTKLLKDSGLKVDLSDGTCIFLTLGQLEQFMARRQPLNAPWPPGARLEYCCYDGCAHCLGSIT